MTGAHTGGEVGPTPTDTKQDHTSHRLVSPCRTTTADMASACWCRRAAAWPPPRCDQSGGVHGRRSWRGDLQEFDGRKSDLRGISSYGFALYSPADQLLLAGNGTLGSRVSVNQAEYHALIRGLQVGTALPHPPPPGHTHPTGGAHSHLRQPRLCTLQLTPAAMALVGLLRWPACKP